MHRGNGSTRWMQRRWVSCELQANETFEVRGGRGGEEIARCIFESANTTPGLGRLQRREKIEICIRGCGRGVRMPYRRFSAGRLRGGRTLRGWRVGYGAWPLEKLRIESAEKVPTSGKKVKVACCSFCYVWQDALQQGRTHVLIGKHDNGICRSGIVGCEMWRRQPG